ncbi:MAG TPA: hypothetical protein DCS55_12215 [Acidimicrobiaceae bacterium]|nr:hypothetical protein [Acidimicrobiaceae bacterium]
MPEVLLGYLLALVAAGIASGVVGLVTLDADGPLTILAGQVGLWAGFVGVVVYARSRPGAPRYVGAVRTELHASDVLGLVVGVATQLVLLPLLYLPFRSWFDEDDLSAPAEDLLADFNGILLVLMGVGVVLVAPVVEELFFRGLLLGTLRERWGTLAAVIGSSLFFGATHFQPLQFAGLTAAGLVFAAAVVKTGRLGTAIAVHVGFNATTFTALVLL